MAPKKREQIMFVKQNNQYSVECLSKGAPECPQQGEFQDSEEDAQEWVEDECWIPTGEGYICPDCNIHHMRNLVKIRRDMEQEKIQDDDEDDDPTVELEVGIDDQSG